MALGYLWGVFESSPGNEQNTPGTSTKNMYFPLLNFNPQPGVNHMERDDEVRNIDEPLSVLTELYDPQWSVESRLYPDTAGFFLKLMLGAPTTTAGNGTITDQDGVAVPVGAYRHQWVAPFGPAGLNPQTAEFKVAYKDQGVFYRLKGCGCSQLSISSPESGGVRIAASGPCLYMTDIADPTLTAAYETLSIRPFVRANLSVPTWLSGTGEARDFTFQLANAQNKVRTLGIASKWADVLEKADAPIMATGTIPKRVLDQQDVDALEAATGFATKAKWVSDSIIASGYPYKLFVTTANTQYTDGGPEALENKRNIGQELSWKATNASGSPGHLTIELVNATASYV